MWPCFKGALRALCEKLSVLDPFSLAKVTAVTTALLHTGLLQILTQSKTSENELQQFMFQTDNARLLSGWIWESSLTIGCCAHSVQKRPKIWPRCIQLLSWVRGASVRCAGTVQKVGYFWKVTAAVDNLVVWVCPVLRGTSAGVKICDTYGPQRTKGSFIEFEVGLHDDALQKRLHSHVPFIGR